MGRHVGITGFRTLEEVESGHCLAKSISDCATSPKISYGMVFYLQTKQRTLSPDELYRFCNAVKPLDPPGKAIGHLHELAGIESPGDLLIELTEIVPSSVSIQLNKFDWGSSHINHMKSSYQEISSFSLQSSRKRVIEGIPVIERNIHAIDTILIDASEGNGELCDVVQISNIASKLRTTFPALSLGVAGGLGTGGAAHLVPQLRSLTPIG